METIKIADGMFDSIPLAKVDAEQMWKAVILSPYFLSSCSYTPKMHPVNGECGMLFSIEDSVIIPLIRLIVNNGEVV